MLKRLVTERRLVDGTWGIPLPSQFRNSCDLISFQVLGAITLLICLWFLAFSENLFFKELEELNDIGVIEQPCASDSFKTKTGLVHLQGCDLSGLEEFSSETPGLEWLRDFEDNLPTKSLGAYFKVNVERHTRKSVESLEEPHGNLRPGMVFSERVRIGSHQADSQLLALIPPMQVHLSTDQEQGECPGSIGTPFFCSRNMVNDNNMLYHYDLVGKWDIRMGFTVGFAQTVSVLSYQLASGRLEPWVLHSSGRNVSLVEAGTVSLDNMVGHIRSQIWSDLWGARIGSFLLCWICSFMLFFTDYFDDLFSKRRQSHVWDDMNAALRAFPLAVVPAMLVILATRVVCICPIAGLFAAAMALALCFWAFTGTVPRFVLEKLRAATASFQANSSGVVLRVESRKSAEPEVAAAPREASVPPCGSTPGDLEMPLLLGPVPNASGQPMSNLSHETRMLLLGMALGLAVVMGVFLLGLVDATMD